MLSRGGVSRDVMLRELRQQRFSSQREVTEEEGQGTVQRRPWHMQWLWMFCHVKDVTEQTENPQLRL